MNVLGVVLTFIGQAAGSPSTTSQNGATTSLHPMTSSNGTALCAVSQPLAVYAIDAMTSQGNCSIPPVTVCAWRCTTSSYCAFVNVRMGGKPGGGVTCELFNSSCVVFGSQPGCALYQAAGYSNGVKVVTNCQDVFDNNPNAPSGVYWIQIGRIKVQVYCNMDTDNSTGWTVFQRRMDGSVNFNRSWAEYQNGFGNQSREFWLGNEVLAAMTASMRYQLRIDIQVHAGGTDQWIEYSDFVIGSAVQNYTLLSVGNYTGTLLDSMTQIYLGAPFSTYDRDNYHGSNCSYSFRGPWWYRDCATLQALSCSWTFPGCQYANLNGAYGAKYGLGVVWPSYTGYSLSFCEMKLRPVSC